MTETTLPAPLWRRLTALLYDGLLLIALWLTAALVLLVGAQFAGKQADPSVTRAVLFLVTFGFYGWFWTHGGQTLGMRAWRLRVRRNDGEDLSWSAAMLRFATASVTLGFGLLLCLFDPRRRALHDLVAGSEVVLLPKP